MTLAPRDELWDMMLHVCGWEYETMTPSARGWVNQALKDLRAVNATPDDLLFRARNYFMSYGRRPTPTAMTKHWSAMAFKPLRISDRELDRHARQENRAALRQRIVDEAG